MVSGSSKPVVEFGYRTSLLLQDYTRSTSDHSRMDDVEIIGAEAAEPETVMTTLTDMDMIGMVALEEDFERAIVFMYVLPVLNLSDYLYFCARYLQATLRNYSIHEHSRRHRHSHRHSRRHSRRHRHSHRHSHRRSHTHSYRPKRYMCIHMCIHLRISPKIVWNSIREAWRALEGMSREQAMTEFMEAMDGIIPDWRSLFVAPRSSATGLGHRVSTMLPEEEEELSDEEKSIFDWCKEGEVEQVRLLLSGENADINQVDEEGLTLLHWACDRGHLEVVTFLIELGVNMNALDSDGQTPLHYACTCEYLPIIETLVKHGSNINARDTDGNTPADNTYREDIHQLLVGVYQGGEELRMSDDSDDDHDYQIPNEDYDISVDSHEEEYLAPEFEPQTCPRVPPRQESMPSSQLFDSSAGTSSVPGDYMVVVQDDHEEPRMPPGLVTSRSSTDSSNSSSSTGPGRPGPIPSSNSTDLGEGEDLCWGDWKSPSLGKKNQDLQAKKEKEVPVSKDKDGQVMKRKPQPLPKPAVDLKPKPKPKPSPGTSPGTKDKPVLLPRLGSTEQESHDDDAGGVYEIMNAADAQKIQMARHKNGLPAITSTYDPEETSNHQGDYYSEVYERDRED